MICKKIQLSETDENVFLEACIADKVGDFVRKAMIDKEIKGSIILISSNNAIAHFADVAVYASAKAAAEKMSRHAAI